MKKIKYLILVIILICGFLLSGELYQDYLNSFANVCDYATLYSENQIDNTEMYSDLLKSAKSHNIDFFVVDSGNTSLYSSYINIYCSSERVEDYINNNLGVYEGISKSVFLGSTKIGFKDIKDISNLKNQTHFYLIGNRENQSKFKAELVEKYGGSIPRDGANYHSTYRDLVLVWSVLFVFFLILSFYQVQSTKKETLLKVIYGEPLRNIIFKNIIKDTLIFIICFTVIYHIMSFFCYTKYHFKLVSIMFLIMIVINMIFNLSILKFNIKRDLSKSKYNKTTLILNYIFKSILTIVTLSVITSNVAIIFNGLSYYSQKDFFEKHSDYYYVYSCIDTAKFSEENLLECGKYEYEFYQYFTGRGKAITQVDFDTLETENEEYNIVYINKNNISYLIECTDEFSKDDFTEDKVYYIFPESFKNSKDFELYLYDFDDTVRFNFELERNNQYDYIIKSYRNNIKMIEISDDFAYKSDYIKNPIIVYNNIDESTDNYEITSWQRLLYCKNIMYKIDNNSIDEIEKNAGYSHDEIYYEIENVYEVFQKNLEHIKRIIYINTIITLVVLILNIAMTTLTISLEYSVNKIEHAIKKTLGYSKFEQLKKMYLISIITSSVGIVLFMILNYIFKLTDIIIAPICGIIMIFIDVIVITVFSKRKEKENINKVIKGG